MEEINCTNRSINTTLNELNRAQVLLHLPVMIFYVVAMVIGLIGNASVMFIYKYKFKRSSARVYILFLALLDFSVCLVGIPYHVLDLTWLLTYKSAIACKSLSFFISSFTLSSVFVLLVVGLDRYFKVCRPLKKQIVDFGDRKACIIAIIAAIVISIPNAILYGQRTEKTSHPCIEGVACFVSDFFVESMFSIGFLGIWMLIFVLSVTFLIVIYGLIGRKIYRHDKMQGNIVLNKNKSICCGCFTGNENTDGADEEIDYDEAVDSDEIATCMKSEDIDVKEHNDVIEPEHESLVDNKEGQTSKTGDTANRASAKSVSKSTRKSRTPNNLQKHDQGLPSTVKRHGSPRQEIGEKYKKDNSNDDDDYHCVYRELSPFYSDIVA